MFCPECRDEFREGFTRCGRCDVDLVPQLPEEGAPRPKAKAAPAGPLQFVEYCGFLTLDDVRSARDLLAEESIAWEIAIRPGDEGEEFWLRVDSTKTRRVAMLLGDVPVVEGEDSGGFSCGECQAHVGEHDEVCPGCGARFDE